MTLVKDSQPDFIQRDDYNWFCSRGSTLNTVRKSGMCEWSRGQKKQVLVERVVLGEAARCSLGRNGGGKASHRDWCWRADWLRKRALQVLGHVYNDRPRMSLCCPSHPQSRKFGRSPHWERWSCNGGRHGHLCDGGVSGGQSTLLCLLQCVSLDGWNDSNFLFMWEPHSWEPLQGPQSSLVFTMMDLCPLLLENCSSWEKMQQHTFLPRTQLRICLWQMHLQTK